MNLNKFLSKDFLASLQIVDWGYTEESAPLNYEKYKNWLKEKKHLPLKYLEGERAEIRSDLKNFYPEFQSALVFLFSYEEMHRYLKQKYKLKFIHKIASYTLGFKGLDYHFVIRDYLNIIGEKLKIENSSIEYVLSIDIHPVLERDLAVRAGLGWQGKNSMFISKKHGSFFIIGSILINQKLGIEASPLETDHCGQCTRCIENCPTNAIDPTSRTIISKDCISTFTIEEFKLDTIPSEKMDLKSGYVFGCDICQTVCPWNIRLERVSNTKQIALNSKQNEILEFFDRPTEDLIKILDSYSNKDYTNKFKSTSFERSGKRGLLKNLNLFFKKINQF